MATDNFPVRLGKVNESITRSEVEVALRGCKGRLFSVPLRVSDPIGLHSIVSHFMLFSGVKAPKLIEHINI